MKPVYPIYIPSKGRWDKQLTARTFDRMGLPHYMIVEADQRAQYEANKYPTTTLLTLDPQYQVDYDAFDEFGMTKSKGPGPARNFAWDHAISIGADYHWVCDDNCDGLYRLNHNLKTPVVDGTIMRAMEAFVERYDNIAMAGPNYYMFAVRRQPRNPYVLNTRIYSFNLIRNDVPYRWRGRYNEDTDISLRMLKDGWCTILFTSFLTNKLVTQQLKGGNTEAFYAKEGTLPKSEMIARMHPDVARVEWRFHRWHHIVDYNVFKQQPHRKPDLEIPHGVDNFGMVLERFDFDSKDWVQVLTPTDELPVLEEAVP